jgi:molecular chaperone HscC
VILGIDLGTTNSLVGIWRDGAPQLFPNALGGLLTPSVVGIDDTGNVLVGKAARDRLASHPVLTTAAFKRHMGTDRVVRLGRHEFRAEELSALVLRSLKADAEATLGEAVSRAVITVPAYFNEVQRRATHNAAELAGLVVERLVSEPTAAALAYGIHDAAGDLQRVLVIDLGGGTFDVSVLEFFEGVIEVRATAGDIMLGGEDFTDALVRQFMKEVGHGAGMPAVAGGGIAHAVLRSKLEQAKCELARIDQVAVEVPFQGKMLTWSITREQFEELTKPLLLRLRQPIERALRDARLTADAVSRVILVGGATRMPMIRRLAAQLFGKLPDQRIDVDEVVARGACVQAGLLVSDKALTETVMTDIAAFSLGIEVSEREFGSSRLDGCFLPIIERATVIPASRVKDVVTVQDGQSEIEVCIFQGEARFVKDNVELGKFHVPIPRAPAGHEPVDIRFTYDPSGLLEVEATVQSTGHSRVLVIEGHPGRMSKKEIADRLKSLEALKIHPRDDAQNAAVLARAGRLYEEHLGEARVMVGKWIVAFTAVLDQQDERAIEDARRDLTEALDQFESYPLA